MRPANRYQKAVEYAPIFLEEIVPNMSPIPQAAKE